MMESIIIDGREFHGVTQELSAAQDDYLIGQLRLAGALDVMLGVGGRPGPRQGEPGDKIDAPETPEEQAERLLTQIMISGRGAQVLAGCLTEAGKPWTFEEATRNAAIFAAITNAQDKLAMREAIVGFVTGFFLYANRSARTSRKSSGLS